jgi:hypothetical protein
MTVKGIFGRGERLKSVLALVAAMSLLAGLAAVSAQAGGSSSTASAAKKKCKKAKKSSASAAKKKRCKKKKVTPTPPTVPAVPVLRATLTWTGAGSDDADLDLFAFNAAGQTAGNGSDTIPGSILSPDLMGPAGTETFTAPAGVAYSFAVCYTVGGSVHAPFTITYVTADGVSHTDSENPGSSFHYDYPAGVTIPAGYCAH